MKSSTTDDLAVLFENDKVTDILADREGAREQRSISRVRADETIIPSASGRTASRVHMSRDFRRCRRTEMVLIRAL